MPESVPREATREYPGPAPPPPAPAGPPTVRPQPATVAGPDPAAAFGPPTLTRPPGPPPAEPPTEQAPGMEPSAADNGPAVAVEPTDFSVSPPAGEADGDPALATLPGPLTRAVSRPRTVAGYEVLGELGRGGMGVVYQARQTALNRLVALKMILAGAHAGPYELLRFRTEAEAVARLRHPNIVQIYEVGEADGCPYFSLEFVDGGSLADQLDGTPLPQRRAAELIETLARAMHHAHTQGIVHRDLKPGNILLQKSEVRGQKSEVRGQRSEVRGQRSEVRGQKPEGVAVGSRPLSSDLWPLTSDLCPKITDFGLAKRLDTDQGPTVTGSIMGTPSYMAPEQAAGRLHDIGPLTDVYALGALLYECLTGRPPFKAPTPMETMNQVLTLEPVPPRRLQPDVAHDLETVCLKGLQKEPARRYASAAALADDLGRWLRGEPIQARPVGTLERGLKWARRRPAVAALVAVSAAAALGLLGIVAWHYADLRTTLEDAQVRWQQAEEWRRNEAARFRKLEQDRKEGERLAKLRAEADGLLTDAAQDVEKEDWKAARARLLKAQDRIDVEADLADLRPRAAGLLARCDRLERLRDDVRATYERFGTLYDDALFHGTLLTGVDVPADLAACQAAARAALALYGVTEDGTAGPRFPDRYLTAAEKQTVTARCYDLLLTLAEATAQPLPGDPLARRREQLTHALALLDRAGRLGLTTRAYHLRRSTYLARLGDTARAAAEWCRAEAVPPASANDDFLIGDLSYRAEDLPAALAHFHRALDRDPKHFWARYFLAVCYLKTDRPREAIAYLTSCLSQHDFPGAHLLRGYAYGQVGDFAAAEADYAAVARHDPRDYGLYVNRGLTRLDQGKMAAAIADFQEAIRLKPDQYQAHVNLAEAYRKQNQLDAALGELNRAVRAAPTVARNYWRRGLLRVDRGELPDARADFRRAVRLENPASRLLADYQVALGNVLHRQRRDADALAACDAALKSDPDAVGAHQLRAEVLLALKRGPEALAELDQYLRRDPADAHAYRERGFERAKRGDYAGAVADYSRSLDLDPKSAPARRARGWAYLNEAAAIALADFDRALKSDRDNADLHAGRGYALALLGRYREAAAAAEEALRHDRRDADPRARLALRFNAACVFAQARAQAAGATNDPDGPQLADRYAGRAVSLLRDALELLAPAERGPYLRQALEEPALAPVRPGPAFAKLTAEYGK